MSTTVVEGELVLRAIVVPEVSSDEAQGFMAGIEDQIEHIAVRCGLFGGDQ